MKKKVIMNSKLKSPYPYFGGKSRVAEVIWQGLGDIEHYVEPFAGSLAVLLSNNKICKMETVNDIDCFIINFWRAISHDPEGVAKYADYPVTEIDLHARHRWLLEQANNEFITKMDNDPNFYDVKMAGWWVWGISASIGNNWLQPKGLKALPIIGYAGAGVHGMSASILDWFKQLQSRIRRVRLCCGDWKRMLTPSVIDKNRGLSVNGMTGIFLDPPYDKKKRERIYKNEEDIYGEVCKWAIENGENNKLRIVVCGYEGFEFPGNWKQYSWKSNGGMANIGNSQGKENAEKERIYFSPYCLY